jgi:S-adenosylmethionine decarboxylase
MTEIHGPQLVLPPAELPDLAPGIHRQRLVVEGVPTAPVCADDVIDYLGSLSEVLDMHVLSPPVTHRSERYGWAGWIHWETSGAHLYAWEQPQLFLSVDIYTCKPFDPMAAVDHAATFFAMSRVVARPF